MAYRRNRRWKSIVLIQFVVLILIVAFCMYASGEIKNALLRTKFDDMVVFVESLNAAMEANTGRPAREHEAYIHTAIERLDREAQLFAAVYQQLDGELTIVTERWYETSPLDLLARPEFLEAISEDTFGKLVIGDTPEGQQYRDNLVYFRWMPVHSNDESRCLMVVAVSYLCIDPAPLLWVAIGQWMCIGLTFGLSVWLALLLVRMGPAYDQHEDENRRNGRATDGRYR